MNYKVIVIKEPYHYYEKSEYVRKILSDVFKIQLEGYKTYYPEGVCTVGEIDFFTNHIIVLDKTFNRVLLTLKILKHATCIKYGKRFPLLSMLSELPDKRFYHEVSKWLQENPNSAYGHNWTVDPKLSKTVKKELHDIMYGVYGQFYSDEIGIDSMIDVSVKKFKIHEQKEWMGNTYFENLTDFPLKDFGNSDGVLMYNKGLKWSDSYLSFLKKYKPLWESRDVISIDNFNMDQDKKSA